MSARLPCTPPGPVLGRAGEGVRVEQPPRLWHVAVTEATLEALLEAAARSLGVPPHGDDGGGVASLTANNVEIPPDAELRAAEPGPWVAFTFRGPGRWAEEGVWAPGQRRPHRPLDRLVGDLERLGAGLAYTRNHGSERTLTVLVRAVIPPPPAS